MTKDFQKYHFTSFLVSFNRRPLLLSETELHMPPLVTLNPNPIYLYKVNNIM